LYQAVIDWQQKIQHYPIKKEHLLFIEGVVPAISVCIQALTNVGDAVLINTPVYPPFARTITLNKRQLVNNHLVIENGIYHLDLEQLERDFAEHQVKMYLFCSPHNPGGRVWTLDELRAVVALCQKYNVLLVSDEIHQDLTLFDNIHYTINTVSDYRQTVVLTSATKTFNIAGTKNSVVFIEDDKLRTAFKNQQLANNQHEISSLGMIATQVAYSQGFPYLLQLKKVLEGNVNFVVDYFAKYAPRVKVMKPQGTYLIWLDFNDYHFTDSELATLLKTQAKVLLNAGISFGDNGSGFMRINIASPSEIVYEAVGRIIKCLPK
jgi:cystathionine beta-lyase